LGLCKKVFLGASRQIIFGWRHLFPDFAKQNQEKDVSIQKIFRRRRRRKPFYTTPKNILLLQAAKTFLQNPLFKGGLCKKVFYGASQLCFEGHVIFTISRSEIVKMTCPSEEYSAAAGGIFLIR
jgi:hypothetical protein